jgi:hypothetical protein
VGFTVDVLPRVRSGSIELAIHAEALNMIRNESGVATGTTTNVVTSARVTLKTHESGKATISPGVLVTQRSAGASSTGIFVLPAIYRPQR